LSANACTTSEQFVVLLGSEAQPLMMTSAINVKPIPRLPICNIPLSDPRTVSRQTQLTSKFNYGRYLARTIHSSLPASVPSRPILSRPHRADSPSFAPEKPRPSGRGVNGAPVGLADIEPSL
jgi:hypothetical protein